MTGELEEARRESRVVYSSDGEELGRVDAVYYDLASGTPEWLGVCSEPLAARTLLPVEGATLSGDALHVPYPGERVRRAPPVETEEIDDEFARRLAAHYGLDDQRDTEVLPLKEKVEVGRVRARKFVEAEPVTIDVELEREVARVVREAVGEPVEGVELGEAVIEIPLYAERPVVRKRVVAAERITLEKDVETER